jgi:uncharacterized membrane-anchored protein YhcB (DUF1043 family)
MTVIKAAETLAGTSIVGWVATEQIIPEATWAEKLGTMSVIVVAGVFIVQWLMKQLEKKDAAMRELHDDARKSLQDANAAAAKAHAEATAMIVAELRAGYEVKRAVASSLSELTAALRDQRRQ